MNGRPYVSLRWPAAVAAAVLLVAAGAIGSYLAMTSRIQPPDESRARPPIPVDGRPSTLSIDTSDRAGHAPLPDLVVTLSEEAVRRAGIVVASVESGSASDSFRLPAVVEPNSYKQVNVSPLVAGRVTRVLVELGDRVRQGQTMATLFSPELPEAQSRFISAGAELAAHERELARTEKLVQIGAASRQELERLHAEHTSQLRIVDSLRSRLELLGMTPEALEGLGSGKTLDATINVPAPISGVVTERLANVGLNVEPAVKLFTIVDLSSVWVVADLYENDFSRVHQGDPATIVLKAYPDLRLQSRVSYIDPQVSPATRTAKVRVEVPNPRNDLRLGMLAEAQIQGANAASVALLPRSALQNLGDRTVVYLATPGAPGQFIEREVRPGRPSGDRIEVLSGVVRGDHIVVDGSFFLRAERDRLGLRQATPAIAPAGAVPAVSANADQRTSPSIQTGKVIVGEQGYEPARLTLRAGVPARLTFVRTTDKTCGTEVVFPSLNIKRPLPLNQAVDIEFTPEKSGDIAFVCGMNMLKGVIVVQ